MNPSARSIPRWSSSAAMASAWSAASIGRSSLPSAPTQSIASRRCSRGRSSRLAPATSRAPEIRASRPHDDRPKCRRRPAERAVSLPDQLVTQCDSRARPPWRTELQHDLARAGTRCRRTAPCPLARCIDRSGSSSSPSTSSSEACGATDSFGSHRSGGEPQPSAGGPQVPAGLGTFEAAFAAPGCPGVFGPVPQPVSMDGPQMPAAGDAVNRRG